MLRIIHTADVHLGARHDDLGEQAAAQRERQFAAFQATVDLALAEKVDLFLIAGDLFDSNVQPRRSVERVAAELKRLAMARIRTVIIPGTHDVYDRTSIYRAYDLKAMAGSTDRDDLVTVLTPELRRSISPRSTSWSTAASSTPSVRRSARCRASTPATDNDGATWRVGLVHGSIAIPGKTDRDEVVITSDEIAASRLDYLALGHWHSTQQGRAGAVTYAYAGAPEAGRARPGPRRQGPARRARGDRRQAERHDRGPRSSAGRRSSNSRLDAAPSATPAGPRREPRQAGRPGPRPRRPGRRRPAGRARPPRRRDRGGARRVVPQGPRPRRLGCPR